MPATIDELSCLVKNPHTTAVGSVIWLHGLGADGHDFLPIINQLKLPETLPLRFIFPHAPQRPITLNQGYVMRAWYDIFSFDFNNRTDIASLQMSIQQINHLIEQEEKLGIASSNIILAGFSQGAVVALHTGLRYKNKLAGIIALSGYLPDATSLLAEISSPNHHLPVFLAHGTQDDIVPFAIGEKAHQTLQDQPLALEWHSYAMGHSVCHTEIQDIAKWIKNLEGFKKD